ncbi:MAG: pilus assembly protein N-terminal domain-containing protein [Candidatus Eremiobacteraeota bacterium]|nr:pilus assembly protein N-terminal domain-containing protein [Candidatus Eremiobacteraeota bacterium]
MRTGESTVLSTPGLSRVAVGNSAIAGVVPVGTSEVVVNAKDNGQTTVVVWEGQAQITYTVVVTDGGLDNIAGMVKAAVADPDVHFVNFAHALIVRGTVDTRAQYAELQSILNRFEPMAKANHFTIVNAVTLRHSYTEIGRALSISGARDISVEPDGAGNLIVSGEVDSLEHAEQILAKAQSLAGADFGATGKLIDRLSVRGVTQIDIKLYVLEVDQSAMQQLGLRLQSAQINSSVSGGFVYGPPSFPITENCGSCSDGKALNIGPWVRTTLLAPTLDLLMQTGHARILSSPDLVAQSGTEASFLVGGQIPYLFSSGLGQVSVVFKPYGVNLKVTPTLLPNGDVQAAVTPDISDLDYQNSVSFAGYTVPAIKESTLSTNVVAASGDSIVLGGLLNHIDQRTIQKIPLLSSIPVLGKLFQSTEYQHSETQVVFVMTPHVLTSK